MIYLVTGGAGSIGGELTRHLLKDPQNTVRIFSRNDSTHHEFKTSIPEDQQSRLRTILGDVRNKESVTRAISGCDVVFHCAALKHVVNSGYNASEVAEVNIMGTQTVLDVAHSSEKCDTMVLLSTDKTINPTNVMGCSKAVAERIVLDSNWTKLKRRVVRFGNVWNSRGSVFPTFVKNLLTNKPLFVTNLTATRFIITKKEAAELLLLAAKTGIEKSLLITKIMKAVSVEDIVKLAYKKVGANITDKITLKGLQPGEKLHEELIATHELEHIIKEENDVLYLSPHRVTNYITVRQLKRKSNQAEKACLEKLINE